MAMKITKQGRRLFLLGLASYLVFMFVSVPASFLTRYILPRVEAARSLKLQNVHGSIWNGEANDARLASFDLGKLDWELSGWGLITGNVKLKLKAKNESSHASGHVTLGFDGMFDASDVALAFPAETLQPLFYGFPISIAGEVSGRLEQLSYLEDELLIAEGRLLWQGAALRAPQNIELGDFEINFTPHNNGSKIKLTDRGDGPVKAEINVRIDGKGKYGMNGWLQARDASQQHITEALRVLGRADNSGRYWVAYSGSFSKQSQRGRGRRIR